MSLSRAAVGSSAVALALVLVAPAAAFADSDHSHSGNHGNGAATADGHNPPGNNGTIKIDYPAPADSGHANRPHPGCAFQLRMFGFDDDQHGTVTFVGQAPTKLGTLLTQQDVLLSDDDAGGGQDVDAVYSYTAAQLGLVGQPQAKQGWHVKVSVNADDAPGGAKQKVFWLSCPPSTQTSGSAGGPATQPQGSAEQSTVTTKAVSTSATSGSATSGARAGVVRSFGAGVAGAATAGSAATGAGLGGTSAAPAQTRGSGLPFTGFGFAAVLAFALAALVAGSLAIQAGRRRTAHT